MVRKLLSQRMISSEKSPTFRDHALGKQRGVRRPQRAAKKTMAAVNTVVEVTKPTQARLREGIGEEVSVEVVIEMSRR